MKYIIQLITLITLVCSANTAIAKGGKPPPAPEPGLLNVVTVSPQYGDYTSPVEALNDIPDTNVDPYLIIVGPGVYEVNSAIHMKEGVTIQGAGQESTIITGAVSNSFANEFSAIVKGANNSALTDLTIINRGGGGTYSIAIFNSRASPRIERVTAIAMGEGGYANTGVLNELYSSPIMTNVTASASSEGETIETFGVYNVAGSSPTMVNVKSSATGGSWRNSGVYIADSSPFIVESVLDGSPGLMLEIDCSGSRIVNNKIIGGVYGVGSVCRGNYDEDLVNVDCPTP